MLTILFIGGNSGIGLESVKNLSEKSDVSLILAGRNLEKINDLADSLKRRNNLLKIKTIELDVSSLKSVREAAEQIKRLIAEGQIGRLDALACNAGVQFLNSISYSADGYEETFATNFLGYFLLVNLLRDEMAETGRIVFTASGTHDPETMDGKMVGKAVAPDAFKLASTGKDGKKPISGGRRYTTSKLCVILFAYELDRRLKLNGESIESIAFDPGFIPETGLGRSAPKFAQFLSTTKLVKWIVGKMGVTMSTAAFSGAGLAEVIISPKFKNVSGKYIQAKDGKLHEARSSKTSYDKTFAARLWSDAERLTSIETESVK